MKAQSAPHGLVPTLFLALMLAACGGSDGGSQPAGGGGGGPASFQVAGEISVAFATAADGDVNEPIAPVTPNDDLASAQEIPNPVTLGGYANQPGTGAQGRSFTDGDVRDLYRVSLAGGQMLRLFIGDELAGDLDLALLALDGTQLMSSDGATALETLVVATSGDYLVEVSAFAGGSTYVLSVGQGSPASAAPTASEFVPGQLIVRFRDDGGRTPSAATLVARTQSLGMDLLGSAPGGEALLACRDRSQLEAALRAAGVGHLLDAAGVRSAGAPQPRTADDPQQPRDVGDLREMRRDTRRLAKALRARKDVQSADLNYLRQAAALPADELYPLQWHYPLIHLPEAWDNVAPDSGVVVAVIDTGVVSSHPDLAGQLLPGYDFISDPLRALDGNGCDADPEDPGDGAAVGSNSYHGTHVAGTLVARTSLQPAGDIAGGAGVAWNARVMPLRVLGAGGGTDFDLIQAIRYAAGLDNACGVFPGQPADVVNLSLGGPDQSASLDAAVQDARNAGVTVVAAAGNFASSSPFYPAASPGAIAVSAVDAAASLAPYSNFGGAVDVAAPGGDLGADLGGDGYPDGVLSTLLDDGAGGGFVYGYYHGTSMAAPHVSGVIALMLGVNGNLTPFDIDGLLAAGDLTENIGSSFFYGNGLIDAFAAVAAAFDAAGGSPPVNEPRLEVDPGVVHFGSIGTLASLDAANAGGDGRALVIASVAASTDDGAGWLSVAEDNVDADGLGRYQALVDRSGLANGIYTGSIFFDSDANDVTLGVVMQVGAAAAGSADAGLHFVLLVDAETLTTEQAIALNVSGGIYRYRFAAVEEGEYLVVAGTDSDNDQFICDAGEACGAYATLDEPEPIVVDRDLDTLDFLTGFELRLSGTAAGLPASGRPRGIGRGVAPGSL